MKLARRLPVDARLPALPALFDGPAMARRLNVALVAEHDGHDLPATVTHCLIDRIKYRPGRNCTVGYRLTVRPHRNAVPSERRLAVTMYPEAECARRLEQVLSMAAACDQPSSLLSPFVGPMLLPDIGSVAAPFPIDRKLPGLVALARPGRMIAALPGIAADHGARDWRHAVHQVVSYFPGHSCTVRSSNAPGARAAAASPAIFGKVSSSEDGSRTLRAMRELARHSAGDALFGGAEPLHYDADRRILWQSAIEGPALATLLGGGTPHLALWQRLGSAIARFHATPPVSDDVFTAASLREQIERALTVVTAAAPALTADAEALAAQLLRRAADVDAAPSATLHGDLHARNVIVAGDRICFIDLDRVCNGPALLDIGSVLAERIGSECLAGTPVRAAPLNALLRGYSQHGGRAFTHGDLQWHIAAALLRERAFRAVTSLKPGRLDSLPLLIRTARELLDGMIDIAPANIGRVARSTRRAVGA